MLISYLDKLPQKNSVWQFGSNTKKVSDIRAWLNQQSDINRFHNKFVVLAVIDPLKLSSLIVLFDGLASDMLLLPSEFIHGECPFDFKSLGADFIIGEGGSDVEALASEYCVFVGIDDWFSIEDGDLTTEGNYFSHGLYNVVSNWIIPTSGTTGTPKLISHTLKSLSRTVKIDLQKGKEFTWGLMYQLSRFAGLQVFLQSLMSGSKLVFTDTGSSPAKIMNALAEGSCNALSATATMYRKLIIAGGLSTIDLRQITFGGEIADQQVLNSVKRIFPNARVTHVYASTEAGVGFAITDGQAGFPSSYNGSTVSGVAIKVSDDGILLLKKSKLYQASQESLSEISDSDGYVNTGDRVKKEQGRYLFIGRANGAINVGGNKVQPEEVEQVVLELGEISLAWVYGKKNSIAGEVVVAQVIPAEGVKEPGDLRNLVLNHCRSRLADFKVPVIIKVVSHLETNESGKLKRK